MQVNLMHYTQLPLEEFTGHLIYNFDVDAISRACLQELARHRMSSFSVKSSRYTLKELKTSDNLGDFLVSTGVQYLDVANREQLTYVKQALLDGLPNDKAKYCLPEAYKTSLVWTINLRSLQNFLALRTSPSALWEIRDLANEVFTQLPDDHRYLFEEFV